jgi:hypothetical protein
LSIEELPKKMLVVWEKASLEFSGIMFNAMNHLDFSNPSLSILAPASFGVTKTQGNSPRQIQLGIRASF